MANSHIRKKKGVRRGRVILILVIVLVLISALVLGGVALWNNFVKPPEIPTQTVPEGMTRPEACVIQSRFFPDKTKEELFDPTNKPA